MARLVVEARQNVKQGASSIAFAATSSLLTDIGGVYLKDNNVSPVGPTPTSAELDDPDRRRPQAIDPDPARHLWKLSEHLLAA